MILFICCKDSDKREENKINLFIFYPERSYLGCNQSCGAVELDGGQRKMNISAQRMLLQSHYAEMLLLYRSYDSAALIPETATAEKLAKERCGWYLLLGQRTEIV